MIAGRLKLLLVIAVFAAPMVAAWTVYRYGSPSGRVNYGELLTPHPVTALGAARPDGVGVDFSSLRGRWLLVQIDSGACAASCEAKLFRMRQVRLAQGREMDRVARVWLIDDATAPSSTLLERYQGTVLLHAPREAIRANFGESRTGIYLIDPLGNLMLRFPADGDPARMKRDLQRVLSVSQIG